MNQSQIDLVQESFAKVAPIAETAAELFYRRLFELDPTLSKLFKGDMRQQGDKLMTMIAAAVRGLNDLDKLVPVVRQLGVRHSGYGVQVKDYATVGTALLWTLWRRGLAVSLPQKCAKPGQWFTAYWRKPCRMRQCN